MHRSCSVPVKMPLLRHPTSQLPAFLFLWFLNRWSFCHNWKDTNWSCHAKTDWKHFRCELGRWISKVSDLKCQPSSTARFASQWAKLKNSSLKTHFSISRTGDWKPETISQPPDQSLRSPRQKKSHSPPAVWCYSQCLISNSNWQWLLIAEASNNEPPPAVLQSSQHEVILQGICFISASSHFSGAAPANDCGELPSAVWRSVLTSGFKVLICRGNQSKSHRSKLLGTKQLSSTHRAFTTQCDTSSVNTGPKMSHSLKTRGGPSECSSQKIQTQTRSTRQVICISIQGKKKNLCIN